MTRKDIEKIVAGVARDWATGKTFQDIVKDPDPIRFISGLVNYGNWPHRGIDEEVKVAPLERRMVILVDAFSRMVDSGGIEQLVTDPITGGLFDEILACCRIIGAASAVTYLERMANYFPSGNIPRDERARFEMLEDVKRRNSIQNFRALNKEFEGSTVETIEALRRFILCNPETFAAVLSGPR